jgi:hypothetical protein
MVYTWVLCGMLFAAPAVAQSEAEAFLNDLWRRYKTAPALAITVHERETDTRGETVDFGRTTIFCSERGGTRILSPTISWVHLNGQTFGDNRDFPGTYLSRLTGSAGSAALKAMDEMFPNDSIPFDARIRLAATWKEAFAHVLKAIGDDGTLTIEDGAWGDGGAATLLRATAADGSYASVFFIDKATGLLRGRVEQIGTGDEAKLIASVSEPQIRARLGQDIRFATAGRTGFPTYEALEQDFLERYSMPSRAALSPTPSP